MFKNILLAFICLCAGLCVHAQVQFEGIKHVNGTDIYYKVIGSGDPILIVHGGPGLNHDYLLPWLQDLSKKHTLIFYDQRSAGRSALSVRSNMNFTQFAEDMDTLRKLFGYERISVFGHGWGGLLSVYYTLHYQQHVSSLILCGTVPLDHSFDVQMEKNQLSKFSVADSLHNAQLMDTPEFKDGKTSAVLPLMISTFKTAFCDTAQVHQLQLDLPEDYMAAAQSYLGFLKELKDYNYFPQLQNISVPVLIMHGKCDNIPASADEKIHTSVPGSEYLLFEDSGNFPFIEQHKLFIRSINRFYRQKHL